jgi:glycerophosphoryl diester phosphodiesterase
VLELKSRFDGDVAIASRAAAVLRGYCGPVAAMSFDPVLVAAFAERARGIARGLVAQRRPSPSPTAPASDASRPHALALLLHAAGARPHFIACRLQDIATVPPQIARRLLRMPLLTWTVRSEADRSYAVRHADQVIFEGFRPQVKDRA